MGDLRRGCQGFPLASCGRHVSALHTWPGVAAKHRAPRQRGSHLAAGSGTPPTLAPSHLDLWQHPSPSPWKMSHSRACPLFCSCSSGSPQAPESQGQLRLGKAHSEDGSDLVQDTHRSPTVTPVPPHPQLGPCMGGPRPARGPFQEQPNCSLSQLKWLRAETVLFLTAAVATSLHTHKASPEDASPTPAEAHLPCPSAETARGGACAPTGAGPP